MSFNCGHLFALQPQRTHVTLSEVREAYHTARYLSRREDRKAYYASLGLDIHRVEANFPRLEKLQSSWEKSKYPARHWWIQLGSVRIDITHLE